MKTVMKKMFCLMLVAVLMVGVMPFAAFAATYNIEFQVQYPDGTLDVYHHSHGGDTFNAHDFLNYFVPTWSDAYAIKEVWLNGSQVEESTTTPADSDCAMGVVLQDKHVHSYSEATCTTPGTCSCGATNSVDPNNHNYGDWSITTPATCIATGVRTRTCSRDANHTDVEVIPVDSSAHTFSDKGVCTLCKLCKNCNEVDKHRTNCIYYCNGTTNCPNDPTVSTAHNEGCLKTKCNKNGCTLAYGHTGECSVPCTVTAGCVLKQGHTGDCNTPCTFTGCTLGYNHTGDHSNACAICELPLIKSPEHKANCAYYYVNAEPEAKPGNSDLEIWVNLHTANVETKTRLLVTYEDLSPDTLIYEFVADRRDEIANMLHNYYGKDYDWSGHVYDSASAKNPVRTNDDLDEGAAVYINAYTYQDLVYVYVHNTRSYNNIRVILFEGKQIGDTISRDEIVDVVNDYYGLNSLLMYSEDDWKKVVKGKSVDARDYLEVTEEPFHIDVLISGTATAGSGYTADSTNPKTGDMIMAPAIIMCASISALAALFYLNKKRAI